MALSDREILRPALKEVRAFFVWGRWLMVITIRLPMWIVRRLVPASKFKAAELHGIARHSKRWLGGDIEITHEITYKDPRKADTGRE